ncbi:hypothetical protein F3Y22_tig00000538pilonHSYRG00089 [Hibiscus syriacus]|uniref:Uncharacterized protein n=1 Tax=Hibiscus syriacus TaxID=106335 RepID=A0A6A3CZI2_HIBSY|nr:hypothetical protein F3Y22_tig00117000pilonHSYRG00278 [Hibiscus syriacus]KAE8735005.1 hypothetical protein F3Y22_tig00000538pilonHSYRG00089 [Hibiscus syriacus]
MSTGGLWSRVEWMEIVMMARLTLRTTQRKVGRRETRCENQRGEDNRFEDGAGAIDAEGGHTRFNYGATTLSQDGQEWRRYMYILEIFQYSIHEN